MEKFNKSLSQETQSEVGRISDIYISKNGQINIKIQNINEELIGTGVIRDIDAETLKMRSDVEEIKNVKIIRSSNGDRNSPTLVVGSNNGQLTANYGTKGFTVIKDKGSFVSGPVVFNAHPEDIRIWDVYRLNGALTSTVPSTIMTPVPTLVLDMPIFATKGLTDILKSATELFT